MAHENQKIQNPSEGAPKKGLYGAMPSGYTIPPEGSSAIPTGYAAPQAYGAPLKGPFYAQPLAYSAPLQGPYAAQQPIYVAPPPQCPCMRNEHCHTAHTQTPQPKKPPPPTCPCMGKDHCHTAQKPQPAKKPESDCERFFTACCGTLLFCCIMDAIF